MSPPEQASFSSPLAIIGGSGLYSLSSSSIAAQVAIKTPYATEPVLLYEEMLESKPVWFIPRHGREHSIPPHKINYRANLWALQKVGVKQIVAVNAVGGISERMAPGALLIPDQILDYSWGREHTYFDGEHLQGASVFENHIDFTWPYDKHLSEVITRAANKLGIAILSTGTYACTQGPRLETAAEVLKLKNDGVDIVGMTGMPEAALARELEIDYACIALVVNWGAGLTDSVISLDAIKQVLEAGIDDIRLIITSALESPA